LLRSGWIEATGCKKGNLRLSVTDVFDHEPAGRRVGDGEDTADVPSIADPSHWETTPIPTRSGVVLPAGLWLVFLLIAAAGLLVGIAVAAATRPGPPGTVIASATIGPDGGAVSFGAHGLIRVPDGTVTQPVRIVVRRVVVKDRLRVAPPDGPLYSFEPNQLVAYTFGPATVTFAQPVTIVLPLNATGRSGTAFVAADNRILFLPGKVDAKTGTVTITVNDFRFGAGGTGGSA
jgi:hypothetical protein